MPEIYVEWTCRKCLNIHRLRYPLLIASSAFHSIRHNLWEKNGVRIDDPAIVLSQAKQPKTSKTKKYAVYVDSLTPIPTIIDALREYINTFYTPEFQTLKVDVCFNEP